MAWDRNEIRAYNRKRRAAFRAAGRCLCGRPRAEGKKKCSKHVAYFRAYDERTRDIRRARRQSTPEYKARERARERAAARRLNPSFIARQKARDRKRERERYHSGANGRKRQRAYRQSQEYKARRKVQDHARRRTLKWRNARRVQERARIARYRKQGLCGCGRKPWGKRKSCRTCVDNLTAAHHTRRCRLVGNGGKHTSAEWNALKRAYRFRCACCGKRKPLVRDHAKCVAVGGPNYADNLQPLCLSCNSSKHARTGPYVCLCGRPNPEPTKRMKPHPNCC
ncbi:MAG: HNH endonuclease [Terriglobales bacterium]